MERRKMQKKKKRIFVALLTAILVVALKMCIRDRRKAGDGLERV